MLHRFSIRWRLALALAGFAAFAGCNNDMKPIPADGHSTTSNSTSGGSQATASGEQKRIILLNNNDSEFWNAARAGIKSANEKLKLGDAGITAVMEINDGTVQGQIRKLHQFSTQPDVVGVGISVVDPNNPQLIEEMRNLRAKGIPVVCFDSDVDRAKYRDARSYFIGTDNLEGGKLLGAVAKRLKPDGAVYAQFVGRLSAQNAQDRMNGFTTAVGPKFKEAGRWEDGGTDRNKAIENVKIALDQNPDLTMLAGIWSYNAPAIVNAVDQLKKTGLTVVTFDAEAPAITACAEGKIDAMVVQNPFEMGFQSVRLLKALIDKDDKALKEAFPRADQPDGDFFNTGMRIVVPEKSPLKKEMFGEKVEFFTAPEFKKWLSDRGADQFMKQAGFWHFVRAALQRTESGLAIATIAVVAFTMWFDQRHTYWRAPADSAETVARYAVMLGIFALGSAIVIIAGGIDLSAGSMIAFGSTSCATIMLVLDPQGLAANHVGVGVICCGILGAIFVGFLVGCLHTWLITVIGLPPFIATLATMVGLRSFSRVMVSKVTAAIATQQSRIYLDDKKFRMLGNLWVPVVVFCVLAFLCWLLMSRTVVGRHLYALGGNEQAARLSGIRTERLKWLAYCLSAILAAIAGVLYFAYQGSADPQELGQGYELNSIAAAVVGGCGLAGGVGTITGTIMGCLFLQVVINGVAQLIGGGESDLYEGMIVGVVVAAAVTFNLLRQSAARGKRFFPGLLGGLAILTLGLFAVVLLPLIMGKTSGLVTTAVLVAFLIAVKLFEGRRSKVIAPPAAGP